MKLEVQLLICRLVAQCCSTYLTAFVLARHFTRNAQRPAGDFESVQMEFDSESGKSPQSELYNNDTALSTPRDSKIDSPKGSKENSSTWILRAFWWSELLFSLTGIVSTALSIQSSSTKHNFTQFMLTQAPHYSFKVASFCWLGVLAVYVTSQKRLKINVVLCYAVIWLPILFYWLLVLHEEHNIDSRPLSHLRVIWKSVAVFNFALCFSCWVVYAALYSRRGTVSQFVVSKFGAYALCFFFFVSPNIICDALQAGEQQYPILHKVFVIVFQLWPSANAIIALQRFTCCSFVVGRPHVEDEWSAPIGTSTEFHREIMQQRVLTPMLQELKGLEIGEKIGEGVAAVFLGKWRGVFVAVKMKTLMFDSSEELVELQSACNLEIQKEAQVMKGLSHPNIVLFMETGFYRGAICIISEYCARGSLRDVLETARGKELSWPTKLRLAIGIAQGMQYLHNANPPMIHRDLKSPNVLVDESWHAKIADFGTLKFSEIVSSLHSSTNPNTEANIMTGLVGTTRWMAPEVNQGHKTYTSKVDIYSLGVILWELIDGQLPFEHIRWNFEVEKEILKGSRPPISTDRCPAQWRLLIVSCWQAKPEHRPTIQQVIRKLQRIARDDFCVNSKEDSPSHQTLSDQCIFRQSFNPFASSTSCASSMVSKSSKVFCRRRPDELNLQDAEAKKKAAKRFSDFLEIESF
uniref:Protein kinase putative n=1 Tax=Albugo laibachii Nc14 TaxID=890382 RepID=F0W5L2_9STRA|nr:protein kinase putative [Albugo laibachii Nc14]|eukprot:CCA16403.1 protein kinase putative [Albugo laibachii Nc14]